LNQETTIYREDDKMKKLEAHGMTKKTFFWTIIICIFIGGCVTTKGESNLSLDAAIQESSLEISNNLTAGTIIAVVSISSSSINISEYIIEELSIYLPKNKNISVVDRKSLELIRQEMRYQLSGEVSDESARAIGKQLGANVIITGSITMLANDYRLRLRAINVETAVIEQTSSFTISGNDRVLTQLNINTDNVNTNNINANNSLDGIWEDASGVKLWIVGDYATILEADVFGAKCIYDAGLLKWLVNWGDPSLTYERRGETLNIRFDDSTYNLRKRTLQTSAFDGIWQGADSYDDKWTFVFIGNVCLIYSHSYYDHANAWFEDIYEINEFRYTNDVITLIDTFDVSLRDNGRSFRYLFSGNRLVMIGDGETFDLLKF
jgi:TolB-like protein